MAFSQLSELSCPKVLVSYPQTYKMAPVETLGTSVLMTHYPITERIGSQSKNVQCPVLPTIPARRAHAPLGSINVQCLLTLRHSHRVVVACGPDPSTQRANILERDGTQQSNIESAEFK